MKLNIVWDCDPCISTHSPEGIKYHGYEVNHNDLSLGHCAVDMSAETKILIAVTAGQLDLSHEHYTPPCVISSIVLHSSLNLIVSLLNLLVC